MEIQPLPSFLLSSLLEKITTVKAMGSFRKKATKALRSAKSWFKGKGVKSPSSVDLASELSVREDSGVSICTTGLSKGTGIEDGPALFEESQEEASGGTQVRCKMRHGRKCV